MQLFLFLCFASLAAAADLLQQAAPAVNENVEAFLQGAASARSLSKALNIDDPVLDRLAKDIEQNLGDKVREAIEEMLRKIADHVDNGEKVAKELFDKVKELKEKFGDKTGEKTKEMISKIKAKAKETLRKILERLGLGKRNLDDSMDHIARHKFQDIVNLIKEKVVSDDNIKKIQDKIRSLPGDNPISKTLQDTISTMTNDELAQLLRELLESGGQMNLHGEKWDKLKNFLKDLDVRIKDRSRKFGEWVQDMWEKGLDKLRDRYGVIKAIAMEFISHSKDTSAEMSREALEFFRLYKDDLGSLWEKLVQASKEAIGKF